MVNDYYRTDPEMIRTFLRAWFEDEPEVRHQLEVQDGAYVFDPCAGGNKTAVDWEYKPATKDKPAKVVHVPESGMSYPQALHAEMVSPGVRVLTNDIREDSPADFHYDALTREFLPVENRPCMIITNPPFALAQEFVEWGLANVAAGGRVAYLLRLNFKGSAARFHLFRDNPPYREYVHHARPSFLPGGETDSIEYAHMIWRRGHVAPHTISRVI